MVEVGAVTKPDEQTPPADGGQDLHVDMKVGRVEKGGRAVGVAVEKLVGNLIVRSQDQAVLQNRRNKQTLRERVQSDWIEGVLEQHEAVQAVFDQAGGLIKLHKRWMPDAVAFHSVAEDQIGFQKEEETQSISPEMEIVDIFEEANQSLLILGQPGSGKTNALLQLARALIAEAEHDPDAPVPVILNLSSWADKRVSIAEWVVYELNLIQYGVPRDLGRQWIENNDLVLLLDGLDEVDGRYKQDCIEAINDFVVQHGLMGVAVCCRLDEYRNQLVQLQLRAAILLEPLTAEQIDAYFEVVGAPLAGLRTMLEQDASLRELVRTPLMLHIMSLTYRGQPAVAPSAAPEATIARRERLFADYVQRMYKRKMEAKKPYSDEQTTAWLSWLAQRMIEHNQTTFLIENMQPSWLPTADWRWAYMLISRLMLGLIGGLFGGLVIGMGLAPHEGLSHALQRGLAEGVLGGLVAGPVVAIVDMLWITKIGRTKRIGALSLGLQSALKTLVIGLTVGLSVSILFAVIFGLSNWLGRGPLDWWVEGVSVGLIFGLSSGLFFAFGPRGVRHSLNNDIQTVERLSWSYHSALTGGAYGVVAGAIAGAIAGVFAQGTVLLSPLVARGVGTPKIMLIMAVMGMVVLGLAGALFGGMGGTLVKTKKVAPNQGLRLSLINAAVTAPVVGGFFALVSLFIALVLGDASVMLSFVLYGFFIGLLAALWFGGLFAIQHITLRIILWQRGETPSLGKYADFLDYAAHLIFLQKVGGGYIFIHRYLLEHFARIGNDLREVAAKIPANEGVLATSRRSKTSRRSVVPAEQTSSESRAEPVQRTFGNAEEAKLEGVAGAATAQAAEAREIPDAGRAIPYRDMTIEVSDFERVSEGKKRFGRFKVRVLSSPAGEMKPEEAIPVEYDERQLLETLKKLEKRVLDRAGLIALGRTLALLLLPPGEAGTQADVRDLYVDSLKLIGLDQGLRLRLRLPPALAALPWEFMYVDRVGGGDGMDGFLALDPRVAIIRHEALPIPKPLPLATGVIKVVAALASGENLPVLNLKQEKDDLEAALSGQPGIDPVILKDATLDDVQTAIPDADVFHFAGHGAFERKMSDLPGVYSGVGYLALDDQFVDAEQLGVNLRGNGVRLALLGGCETGRRDGVSVWSGIAPALVEAEIPAVVANQYSIRDKTAIAFSRHFYRALVGGLPIERAVCAGRIAAYNADKNGRDWGVPVLYLRAASGQLFEGAPDTETRQQAAAAAEAIVNVRVNEVAAGGEVTGAKVREMLAGKLDVGVVVSGTVYGKVVGLEIDTLGGGSADVDVKAGAVEAGGSVTGAVIDHLG
ncbi:MAG TPA: CHAT domain-containing protein [Caldilineae bacterium]|nr:CHAT domain-containing protein [Caldilineae bacterium]